eukprot:CAMPEP_0169389080 /NCGR_PEP_ID=MMETSP1017-20121227/46496_1 /TAXON_ID=342587 /ORGANISM="Karlodinium micrum, Strain CCMP2283" /LENGTH=144 /DNA_ID=CAMNT_0009491133 /DNA_START=146 /DNA_END=576 /DNA_ORIENTATION=+
MAYITFSYVYLLLVGVIALKVQRSSDAAFLQSMPMDTAVIQQSIQQLVLSQGAMQQAEADSKTAEAIRQEYLAAQSRDGAENYWEKIRGKAPEARKDILPFAAQQAKIAVAGWIADNAAEVALNASKQSHTANKADRLANAVAA